MLAAGSLGWSEIVHALLLAVTQGGAGAVVIGLLLLYSWWIDPATGRRLGIFLGVSFFLNHVSKQLFDLPRPYDVDPERASDLARMTGSGPGFPSGHTQNATTFWGFMAWWYRRGWIRLLALGVVAAVGASRVLLGVHFGLDVAGGLALGVLVAWAGVRLPEPRVPPGWLGVLVALAGGAVLVWLPPPYAPSVGFVVACLLVRAQETVPATWSARIGLALGGATILALGHLLLRVVLLAVGSPGGVGDALIVYSETVVLLWLVLDPWPRWVGRAVGSAGSSRAGG